MIMYEVLKIIQSGKGISLLNMILNVKVLLNMGESKYIFCCKFCMLDI